MNDIVFSPAGSLRERLKTETRPEHEALETALDLLRPGLNLADYGALLARFHAFHLAFDDWMTERATEGWPAARFYCDGRRKARWLSDDLAALGIAPCAIAASVVSVRDRLPALLPSPQHAWGAVYVIEGSTLGGVILSKHFAAALGIAPDSGLRFFSGYGANTGKNWNLVLQQLNGCEEALSDLSQAVVDGARRTFSLLRQHLTAQQQAHGDAHDE